MVSISTVRAFPHTQVILTVEATPTVAGVSTSGNKNDYSAASRKQAAANDHAQLSATGIVLAKALSVPDVRWERVTALKDAIAKGTYQVPASAIASKLIESLAA